MSLQYSVYLYVSNRYCKGAEASRLVKGLQQQYLYSSTKFKYSLTLCGLVLKESNSYLEYPYFAMKDGTVPPGLWLRLQASSLLARPRPGHHNPLLVQQNNRRFYGLLMFYDFMFLGFRTNVLSCIISFILFVVLCSESFREWVVYKPKI